VQESQEAQRLREAVVEWLAPCITWQISRICRSPFQTARIMATSEKPRHDPLAPVLQQVVKEPLPPRSGWTANYLHCFIFAPVYAKHRVVRSHPLRTSHHALSQRAKTRFLSWAVRHPLRLRAVSAGCAYIQSVPPRRGDGMLLL
jgi:hypothetical protein